MLCVSSALPFVECVVVWALKLPVPHTNVLKPTRRKAFLFIYRKLKRYEHLTLTKLMREASWFFKTTLFTCSREKRCIETAHPFAQSHSLARWWGLVSNVRCQFLWIPVIPEKNFVTRGYKHVGMRLAYFACPYPYAFVKRECPRDAKLFYGITENQKVIQS